VGLLVGQSLPALILLIGLVKKYEIGISKLNFSLVKKLFFRHIKFPIYTLPAEFVNRFSNQLPVFMLNHFVGTGAVGVYNLAMRMLGLPISFIGGAISTVFQQRASEDFNRTGSCRAIFIKTFKSLSLISIIPTIIIIVLGPDLFQWAFGQNWREAGVYARILIFMMMLKLIVSPLSFMYFIFNQLKQDFFNSSYLLVSSLLIFYYFFSNYRINEGLLIFSINYSIIYLIVLFRSYNLAKG
jgi:O-antigen/teichoic acid export membrane protein